jgi:hypothetical protein
LAFHSAELGFSHIATAAFQDQILGDLNVSQLSDMHGNTDMSLNMMFWSRGGERSDGLAIAPREQGTTMSLRAKVFASIAFATSAFLLVPTAAQAATHPVQVSGAKLKSALLPASTFGSGFKLTGSEGSGKSLWHQKATKHISTMRCVNFEGLGLAGYGESAGAASIIEDNNPTSLSALSNLLYEQTVYQFPSAKAATTFYNQAHAKYASCKSFSETSSGDTTTIKLKSIAKTKVGTYRAFELTQGVTEPAASGISLKLNTLVTVKGADVFIFTNAGTSSHPVPAKTMLKLITRVAGLH